MIDIRHGDCIDVMRAMEDACVDAICTDPPYELGFMGKSWDATGIANSVEMWTEAYRVLKPGGHLLAFGATRCGHRMACAIEDAGFEIRDCIGWMFGTGFPKSLNVSKALEGSLPADALCACGPDCSQIVPGSQSDCQSYRGSGGEQPHCGQVADQGALPSQGGARTHNHGGCGGDDPDGQSARSHSILTGPHSIGCSPHRALPQSEECQGFDSAQCDTVSSTLNAGLTAGHRTVSHKRSKSRSGDGSASSSRQFSGVGHPNIPHCPTCGKLKVQQGLGTALKPAWEMIYLARKPLSEKTVAANVLEHGTGAINIDACRIPGTKPQVTRGASTFQAKHDGRLSDPSDVGRWPANCIHDGSDEVLAAFAAFGSSKSSDRPRKNSAEAHNKTSSMGKSSGDWVTKGHSDEGTAARFFYSAKASKADRAGSKHPTVKPISLMRYLCKLVCPPGGTVLDMFAGSGTTLQAAMEEGFHAIGIEQSDEYVNDIRNRIGAAREGLGLFAVAAE